MKTKIKKKLIFYSKKFLKYTFFLSSSFFILYKAQNYAKSLNQKIYSHSIQIPKVLITQITSSKEVKGESIQILKKIFTSDQIIKTMLGVLITNIKQDKFIKESIEYSKRLLKSIISEQQTKILIKNWIILLIKDKEIEKNSAKLVKTAINNNLIKDKGADLCKEVILKNDVMNDLMALFGKCTLRALASASFQATARSALTELWLNPEFKEKFLRTMFDLRKREFLLKNTQNVLSDEDFAV